MASSLSSLEEDLACPVCCEIFEEPQVLSCGHSFCRSCLQQIWKGKNAKECAVCRRPSSSDTPPLNVALKNACELLRKEKSVKQVQPSLCPVHQGKLQLFCMEDHQLVCLQCVCQDHQNHSFCSISKAATDHKEKLKDSLEHLKTLLKKLGETKNDCEKTAEHIKCQAQQTERQIKQEFKKLHQFLRAEEEARIAALKEEVRKKSERITHKIEEVNKQITDLSDRISDLDEKMKDDVLFLQDFKRTSEQAQCTVLEPKLDSGSLIDVAKNLGNLRYKVWEKMKSICPYYLSGVVYDSKKRQLPDIPERMSAYCGVLGSEGFTSGTKSWEVDTGESDNWVVGVAEESVCRKLDCVAVPENGFLSIWRIGDKIVAGISEQSINVLMEKSTVKRIRVTLCMDIQQLEFHDVESNKHLHTFTYAFTKKMYPYFYNDSKNLVKILPAQISLSQ